MILDELVDPDVCDEITDRWPVDGWKITDHDNCKGKRALNKLPLIPGPARSLILALNKEENLERFSKIIGRTLLPDPFIVTRGELWGGGLHETTTGGFLNVHVDFNRHPLGVYRRANLLIYLNDADGALMLGSQVIHPKKGRGVLFETTESSWHGHPEPLKCASRKSIAIYYYSADGEDIPTHSTVYLQV